MPSWKKLIVSGSDAAIPSVSTAADFTIDAGGDIVLDADGTDIVLKDGGTEFGSFKRVSSDFVIKSATNDKDIVFKGEDSDGGGTITALTLDMSSGGDAQFKQDVIAYYSSDKRLKDNIVRIENPLEKVDKIGGYTFDWNDKQETYTGKDVGVIAQEIQEVLPELVTERDNGYLAVKYEKIVPLLIESIKELKQEVDDIKQKCDCLNK